MRERIVFGADELPRALSELHSCDGVEEAAILSTCNRTDLYLGLQAGDEGGLLCGVERRGHSAKPITWQPA